MTMKPLCLTWWTGAFLAAAAATAIAQQPPRDLPDPMIRENATVKLAAHSYVIPDGNVVLVPNVGIVVGSQATLVVDTGMGPRNGAAVMREVAKVSRNTKLYLVTTHFHAEHVAGIAAFRLSMHPSTAAMAEPVPNRDGLR